MIGFEKIDSEKQDAVRLALGRIFGMMLRPSEAGDVEEYERCRAIVLDVTDPVTRDTRPNWARDRLRGATGD